MACLAHLQPYQPIYTHPAHILTVDAWFLGQTGQAETVEANKSVM